VTTGDASVAEAAKNYDEELKAATDDQVIEE
jgi:multiple sugar transport system substrate-binding protein